MSQSYSVREPVRAGSQVATGPTMLSRCTSTIAIWLNRRQGRQDLSALDDRLLADIGISREDALWKAGGRSGELELLVVCGWFRRTFRSS